MFTGLTYICEWPAGYCSNSVLFTPTRSLISGGEQNGCHGRIISNPGQSVSLRVTCHQSRLYHSGGVAERVLEAIADRLGQTPPVRKLREDEEGNPPQLIIVRLGENRCAISIDTSGALLYRRGYRLATGRAPLRETLAAGMLLASGWDASSPLLDPFCGAGTIAIEAALIGPESCRRASKDILPSWTGRILIWGCGKNW